MSSDEQAFLGLNEPQKSLTELERAQMNVNESKWA